MEGSIPVFAGSAEPGGQRFGCVAASVGSSRPSAAVEIVAESGLNQERSTAETYLDSGANLDSALKASIFSRLLRTAGGLEEEFVLIEARSG